MRASSSKKGLNDYLKLIGPGTIITLLGFIIAYQFVAPAPPRHIAIATGTPEGAYYKFGSAGTEALKNLVSQSKSFLQPDPQKTWMKISTGSIASKPR